MDDQELQEHLREVVSEDGQVVCTSSRSLPKRRGLPSVAHSAKRVRALAAAVADRIPALEVDLGNYDPSTRGVRSFIHPDLIPTFATSNNAPGRFRGRGSDFPLKLWITLWIIRVCAWEMLYRTGFEQNAGKLCYVCDYNTAV